jgi:hypothetical protein
MISLNKNKYSISSNGVLIVVARGVSDFGAFLNMVALSTYVYLISNSVYHMGVFLACRVAGGVFASIVGTKFFRHFHGKWSLIIFDLLRATLLGVVIILSPDTQLYVLPIIAFGIGFGNSMFSIGLNAQLPYLINAEYRITINSWISSVSATAIVLGSLASGLIIVSSGYNTVFEINMVTYIIAAIAILPLKMISMPQKPQQKQKNYSEMRTLLRGLQDNKMLGYMLILSMADTLGSAAHNVGFPILSKLINPLSTSKIMGVILATWAIGKFCGARLANILLQKQNTVHMEQLFGIGVFLMSTGFILVFHQDSILGLSVFAICAGLGDGISEVSLLSRIQTEPDELRLPIFSLLTLVQMSGFAIGMLIVSPFFTWLTPFAVVLLFHSIPLLVLFISLISLRQYLLATATK